MANFMGKVMDEILEYQVFLGALASIVSGILVRFQTSSCKIVRVLKPKVCKGSCQGNQAVIAVNLSLQSGSQALYRIYSTHLYLLSKCTAS